MPRAAASPLTHSYCWDKSAEERLYQAVLDQLQPQVPDEQVAASASSSLRANQNRIAIDWKLVKQSAFRFSALTPKHLQQKWTRLGVKDVWRIEAERSVQELEERRCLIDCVSVVDTTPYPASRASPHHKHAAAGRKETTTHSKKTTFAFGACGWCLQNQRPCLPFCAGRRHFPPRTPLNPMLLHARSVQIAVCLFHLGVPRSDTQLSIDAQLLLHQIHKMRSKKLRYLRSKLLTRLLLRLAQQ
jgi:hypothetical protein